MRKIVCSCIAVAVLVFSNSALAHVVVRPDHAGVAAFQTFTMSVPSEKEFATVNIRLALPDGLEFVTPTVKPGWQVEVKKHELPGGPHPYEIVWSGGSIPAHFRDDFTFSAKVPASPTTLLWKAYQTYSNGAVVSWDLDPKDEQPKKTDGSPDFSQIGPYSQTNIVDDLSAPAPEEANDTMDMSFALGVAAILIAAASLVVSLKRK